MKNNNPYCDVIIVGAGMVGAATALSLSRSGLKVLIVDHQAAVDFPGNVSARVSAVNIASQQYLQELGVWSKLPKERIAPYNKMFVWDDDGKLEYDNQHLTSSLGWIVENQLLQWCLQQEFKQYPNITFLSNAKVNWLQSFAQDVMVMINEEKWQAKLVIGVDGAESALRSLAGIEIVKKSYRHVAIVANIECEFPHQNTAWQHFLPTGPLAFLPLNKPNLCSIVWSVAEDKVQALMDDSNEMFEKKLADSFGQRLGKVKLVTSRLSFPLTMRHAKDYFSGRVVLLGDALHTIHPLAGLGLNLGLMDSQALCTLLARAYAEKMDLGNSHGLAQFQRERKAANVKVIAAMMFFKEVFSNDNGLVSEIRNTGLNWTNRFGWLKQFFIAQAERL